MRHYTAEEEQQVRMQADVRAWARAGMLDPQQTSALEQTLRCGLKRTTTLLRVVLAAFTALIIAATVGLTFAFFNIHRDLEVATTLLVSGVVCFGLADYLVARFRVYRYGVEETLAVSASLLVTFASVAFVNSRGRAGGHIDMVTALLVCASAALFVYRRFGFVYAGVGAMLCVGLLPFQLGLPASAERICAAAAFGAMFFAARAAYRNQGDDFPGDEHAWLGAAACAGAYLSLNLHASEGVPRWLWTPTLSIDRWFYWSTYVATWLIPGAALADAVRAKDRRLLVVGGAMALATLATNKPYLGLPRQSWDLMLLGTMLFGVAIGLRRWLARGPGGLRNGYTSERVLDRDADLLAIAGNASVIWHGRLHEAAPADPSPSSFGGGRSGGGGAGASF